MKATLFLTVFSIILVCRSEAKDIVVNNPAFSVRSANFMEIEKVVLKKDATIVHFVGIVNGWIRINKDVYLQADGKEYHVQDAMNLTFGQQTNVDEEGKVSFALIFPPLPPRTERFDVCNIDRTVITWDVELKKPKKAKVHAVPEEFVKASLISDDGNSLEAPQWKDANATLKGVFAGYKPELKYSVKVYADNLIVGEQEEYEATINDDGTFEMKVPMIVTSQVLLRFSAKEQEIWLNDFILLSPDKETRLYVDLPAYFRKTAKYRYDRNPDAQFLYFAGANAELNNLYFHTGFSDMMLKNRDDAYKNNDIANMTASEYKAYILKNKQQCIAEIERLPSITLKAKQFFRMILDYNTSYDLYWIEDNMEYAYTRLHNIPRGEKPEGFKPPVLDQEYYDYLKDLPLNAHLSLYCSGYRNAVNACRYMRVNKDTATTVNITFQMIIPPLIEAGKIAEEDMKTANDLKDIDPEVLAQEVLAEGTGKTGLDSLKIQQFFDKYNEDISKMASDIINSRSLGIADILGTSEGLLFDLIKCQNITRSFSSMEPLTDKSEDDLKQIKEPFCVQQVRVMNQKLLDKIEANKLLKNYHADDVQGKENEELYQAIVGRERGKVVLIDFWATWCGPCKSANKMFKPAKEKLDSEQIAFIYLTNESSPLDTWNNMIPELSGNHYRLTKSQYKYMQDRLNVNITGVPSYLILDKNGEKVFFQTGFPGVERLVGKINEALTK